MWGFGRVSNTLAALAFGAFPALADGPTRVVSINLCTDLLAMDLAPDTLIALSPLATDPTSSPVADDAKAFPAIDGTAEAIYLLNPDVVLAGSYSERATVDMLRRLGIRVEEFAPATSVDDIREQIHRMGQILGREEKAMALLASFDDGLAAFKFSDDARPRALAYFANGYSLGKGTLVGDVIEAAGLTNISAEQGQTGGGRVSLEELVLATPDLIVTGERYPSSSRSERILDHPALQKATGGRPIVVVPDRDWICGTPHILAAVETLATAAKAIR